MSFRCRSPRVKVAGRAWRATCKVTVANAEADTRVNVAIRKAPSGLVMVITKPLEDRLHSKTDYLRERKWLTREV